MVDAHPRAHELQTLDVLPDAAFAVDQDLRVVAFNDLCLELVGGTRDGWIGEIPLDLVHPDDLPIALSSIVTVADKAVGTPIELRIRVADGSYRLFEVVGRHVADAGHDGHVTVLTMRDLTQRRRWELAAGDAELFRTIVEHASVVLALVDVNGRVRSASGTFNRQLGHDLSHVVGHDLVEWIDERDRPAFRISFARAVANNRVTVFETSFRNATGRAIPYQLSVTNLADDPVVGGLIVSAIDISARRALETRLTEMATTDSLTGLANRVALVDHLNLRLSSPQLRARDLVVFFMDLDRFKPVNDLHGHDAGDTVLSVIAQRLKAIKRDSDLLARLGGDEFVMVCDGIADEQVASTIAQRIEQAVAHPISVGAGSVQVYASIGWADARVCDSAEGLLAEADAAMYRTKQRRRGRPTQSRLRVAQRRELAEELIVAVHEDPFAHGLRTYLQPVVELPDARVVGAEVLIRWEHDRFGLLSPADLLPIVEDTGLEVQLGSWIIDHAAGLVARWSDHIDDIAVNVSATQLTHPDFAHTVFAALDRHRLQPGRLCIEVTETTILERTAAGGIATVAKALETVKRAGVRVAIDDFGTGYSSLVHVRELPADILKIDRSFVTGMVEQPADHGIVTAVIALAHAVGMTVVAEGVELPTEHDALAALGADRAQGYLYGRPMPVPDFQALIDSPIALRRSA